MRSGTKWVNIIIKRKQEWKKPRKRIKGLDKMWLFFLKNSKWASFVSDFSSLKMAYPHFCLGWRYICNGGFMLTSPLWELNDNNWKIEVGSHSCRNDYFSSGVPGDPILRTSLFWVIELIPKVCPARTSPFIWVGILCQAQHGNSLWDSPLAWKRDLTVKLTHYRRSHLIHLFSSTLFSLSV